MMAKLAKVIWASPASLLGLLVVAGTIVAGGHVRRIDGVIESWGGLATWLLRRIPFVAGGAAAMTLGHVVIGRSSQDLDRSRAHELVHVRQYEKWGPLFLPLYLLASARLWIQGGDPYRDNPFEREAYQEAP